MRKGVTGLDKLVLPAKVTTITTVGKVIFIGFGEGDCFLVSTLGMAGWWYPANSNVKLFAEDARAYVAGKSKLVEEVIQTALKYYRFQLEADDGTVAVYSDMRNFGNLFLTDRAGAKAKSDALGVDLLDPQLKTSQTIAALTQPRNLKKQIADILLDQSTVAGLGNIYRAETLYLAGVSPSRTVESLSALEVEKIARFAAVVLNIAYDTRGVMYYPYDVYLSGLAEHLQGKLFDVLLASFKHVCSKEEFEDAKNQGKFRGHLVYSRRTDHLGHNVRADTFTGRTMWWVPEVQS